MCFSRWFHDCTCDREVWTRKGTDVRTSFKHAIKYNLTSLWRGSGGNRLHPGNGKHASHTPLCQDLSWWNQYRSESICRCDREKKNHFHPLVVPLKSYSVIIMSLRLHNCSVWQWKWKSVILLSNINLPPKRQNLCSKSDVFLLLLLFFYSKSRMFFSYSPFVAQLLLFPWSFVPFSLFL